MTLDVESLKRNIPFYLTSADQRVLVRNLRAIASGNSADYILGEYRDSFENQMLQGDGWRGFQLFLFKSGERLSVRGIVLSNTCDVDPENPRDIPTRVIFAPLVKLSAFEAKLKQSRIAAGKISNKIAAIKAQMTTNMFFLPAGGPLAEDHVVRLDDVHSMPVQTHAESAEREKLFTLNNTGFYMLAFKLSIHFCRLQEKVNRQTQFHA